MIIKKLKRLKGRLAHQLRSNRKVRVNLLRELGHFAPSSAIDWKPKNELTLNTLRELPHSIENLMKLSPDSEGVLLVKDFVKKAKLAANGENEESLARLYVRFGSDKGTAHDYHKLYANLFRDLSQVRTVFEVGVFRGGSLRAHKEFFPEAQIFGFDIDRASFFDEERIRCEWADQTDPKSIVDLARFSPPGGVDLIIDDGLHSIDANLNSLSGLLPLLSARGWMVIEDIDSRLDPIWNLVSTWLNEAGYRSFLLRMEDATVLAVGSRQAKPAK
jgi:hypothetical protein